MFALFSLSDSESLGRGGSVLASVFGGPSVFEIAGKFFHRFGHVFVPAFHGGKEQIKFTPDAFRVVTIGI